MKIRSKLLWQYLSDNGLLDGSAQDIAKGKLEYRRIYKKAWKTRHSSLQKELRVVLSIREYLEINVKASERGIKPTRYVKEVALKSVDLKLSLPNIQILRKILQLIKMVATANDTQYKPLLLEAEKLLLEYIQKNEYGSH